MNNKFFTDYFKFLKEGMGSVNYEYLVKASDKIKAVSKKGNKLIIAGNGGSATMASHVAVNFTKAAGIRAINFNVVNAAQRAKELGMDVITFSGFNRENLLRQLGDINFLGGQKCL